MTLRRAENGKTEDRKEKAAGDESDFGDDSSPLVCQ